MRESNDSTDFYPPSIEAAAREIDEGAASLDRLAIEHEPPAPLPDGLPGVPDFAPELLPDAVRGWAMDIADRVSCPADYVAVPAMLALATALGRKVGVRPQFRTDWTVTANLWGLIVGRPGMMKSPAMAQATAPLKRLAARAQDEYRAASAQWVLDEKAAKLRADVGEKEARKILAKTPTADV